MSDDLFSCDYCGRYADFDEAVVSYALVGREVAGPEDMATTGRRQPRQASDDRVRIVHVYIPAVQRSDYCAERASRPIATCYGSSRG